MSKRLDSITRQTPTGTKPALKFKPKVVSRKTKEERENANKINTPGINRIVEKNNRKLNTKKTNNNNANKKLNGTQLVMSGPLAEGTISLGNNSNTKSNYNNKSLSNPLLEKLKSKALLKENKKIKIKSENDNIFDNNLNDENSDSDNDNNAIDMGKKSILDDDLLDEDGDMDLHKIDIDLFPVRAERNEHREYGEEIKTDKTIKTEFHNEKSVIPSETPSRESTLPPKDNTNDVNPIVKNKLKDSKSLINKDDADLHMNNFQQQSENEKLTEDYNILSNDLKNLNLKNNMFFMQLPCSLPIIDGNLNGKIGKIRIHKSGKLTMKIGKVKFEILRGGSSDFRQDVVLVDNENNNCYHVGNIKEKITAIPKIL